MKNKMFLIVTVCVAGLVCSSLSVSAAEKKKASPAPEASASPAAAKAPRPLPYHGMVSAVDQTAKTFTIAGKTSSRVFKVTDKTAVSKAGQPATMSDITENVEVSGSYWKQEDGSLEAKMVKIGPMGEKKEKGKKKAGASESPAASPKK
jgi:hypothetical protein